LKFASLRQSAVVEDIDMKAPRGLDKALFAKLIAGGATRLDLGVSRHPAWVIQPLPPSIRGS
jgi:hypothetical protein